VLRNQIYARVFGREWIAAHMPGAEILRQRVAYRKGLLRAGSLASAVLAAMAALAFIAKRNASAAEDNALRWKAELNANGVLLRRLEEANNELSRKNADLKGAVA